MASTTQKGRPLSVATPAGEDALLLVGFSGHEGLSQLFSYQLDLAAPVGNEIAFDKVLGQSITVRLELPEGERFFNGLCCRFSQGESNDEFTEYRMEIVPQLWLWTKRAQSRIFQHENVRAILEKVFKGLNPEIVLTGKYEPRDYCVQYRETDFNFANRLMEEEGIFYYFKHANGSHKLVIADNNQAHADVQPNTLLYKNLSENTVEDEDIIYDWGKTQELVSGKYTLWDHCFERPHVHLAASDAILPTVQVGGAEHKLAVGQNGQLEIYDWPGEYAQRFDGIDRGGAERPAELKKLDDDNKRTVVIRMQQEAAPSIVIHGASACRQLVAGHKFTVRTLPSDVQTKALKANGAYVLTSVSHSGRQGGYGSGDSSDFQYHNSFSCIPIALPFRPARTTPKPVVPGTQTAVVVGPAGEEIFTDKYGRIKVQFHWDREGKHNADSSCWVRVGTVWAGKHWGAMHIPRIGQEVIVDFQEGDPDMPIVVGSVFNADQMPAYKLPDERTKSYIKTNTSPGGVGFNEIRFEDKKSKEQIFIHAERNMDVRVKHDSMERVIHDRHLIVGWQKNEEVDGEEVQKKGGDQREQVWQDKHLNVKRNQVEHIEGNIQLLVGKGEAEAGGNVDILIEKDKKETIMGNLMVHVLKTLAAMIDGAVSIIMNNSVTTLVKGDSHTEVKGERREKIGGGQSLAVLGDQKQKITGNNHLQVTADQNEKVAGSQSLTVGMNQEQKVGVKSALEAGQEIHIKAGMKVIIEAGAQLSLKGPGGFVNIGPSGVDIQGIIVNINSGGSAGSGSGAKPKPPEEPQPPDDASKNSPKDASEAKPTVPTKADDAKTGQKSAPG